MATGVTILVELDDNGTAWITGTRTRVMEVVLDKLVYGWNAEEIQLLYPQLTLAQVYASLAYYYENQESLDEEIETERREAETTHGALSNLALRQVLLDLKKIH